MRSRVRHRFWIATAIVVQMIEWVAAVALLLHGDVTVSQVSAAASCPSTGGISCYGAHRVPPGGRAGRSSVGDGRLGYVLVELHAAARRCDEAVRTVEGVDVTKVHESVFAAMPGSASLGRATAVDERWDRTLQVWLGMGRTYSEAVQGAADRYDAAERGNTRAIRAVRTP